MNLLAKILATLLKVIVVLLSVVILFSHLRNYKCNSLLELRNIPGFILLLALGILMRWIVVEKSPVENYLYIVVSIPFVLLLLGFLWSSGCSMSGIGEG